MMNHNMNEVNNFYRPATFEAIMFNEPKKAMLLENYFAKQRENMKMSSIPTVNLTYGIISYRITHICNPGYYGGMGEYLAIKKDCETGNPVRAHKCSEFYDINGCRFAYAADLPMSYLVELMDKNKNNDGVLTQYKNVLKREEENASVIKLLGELKEENEKLKKQISDAKTLLEAVLK